MKILSLISSGLILQAVAVLIYEMLGVWRPAYSEQEIRASIVDTWQESAMVTEVVLLSLVVAASISTYQAIRNKDRLAVIALLFSIVAGATAVYQHMVLTNWVGQLTGQNFGGFYGLY